MTSVRFYEEVADELLKFAVLLPNIRENGCFVSIVNVIPMSFVVGIEKKEKLLSTLLSESCMRKAVL